MTIEEMLQRLDEAAAILRDRAEVMATDDGAIALLHDALLEIGLAKAALIRVLEDA